MKCIHDVEQTESDSISAQGARPEATKEPDFFVDGDVGRVPVYWFPASQFKETYGTEAVVGLARRRPNAQDTIWLNDKYARTAFNQTTVLHEYGHMLGYGHTEGTIMDPYVGGYEDNAPNKRLSGVTESVVEKTDGAQKMNWAWYPWENLQTVIDARANGRALDSTAELAMQKAQERPWYESVFIHGDWDSYGQRHSLGGHRGHATFYEQL